MICKALYAFRLRTASAAVDNPVFVALSPGWVRAAQQERVLERLCKWQIIGSMKDSRKGKKKMPFSPVVLDALLKQHAGPDGLPTQETMFDATGLIEN